ncbi:poly-beta-1,6-N-acetyl-D-glucosamine biosynthesis protein PgaD [Methylobacter psychrophilus]|uniref:poly-beta-1,6-N-acetyl-D-glucosamine biosynthesis protein PgaD n=1 Tax=Methylobacter psychrophilus TaxID=96941 RepID=UPI0021D50E03|nr:poly-beta-1,6-N-acetyl-D-glucosamine biosynthesis protein PgaD [Methylobacter psychrophilus]
MKDYIINAPQLQSLQKRVGALFTWAICWVMWIYLLVPLVTLCSWVLGDKQMINEMRWFGGYKSLLELMEIYVVTLLIMLALWLIWIFYRRLRSRALLPSVHKIVSDTELCAFYQVKVDELQQCRNVSMISVYFDDHGHIVQLDPHINR